MRRQLMVAAALAVCGASMAHGAQFYRLGHLTENDTASQALGLSGDGSVVVGLSGSEAFRWTVDGGLTGLGFLPGDELRSRAADISADGSAIAGLSGSQAYRWTAAGGMVGLGTLPGFDQSQAEAISADGAVVVGRSLDKTAEGNAVEPFRWTASGGMVGLGRLPGAGSPPFGEATAVSGDGSVVVGFSGPQAFRWTPQGGMTGLGFLPTAGANFSSAWDVSPDGSVIVGNSSSVTGDAGEAFRWTAANGMVGLGQLPGGSRGTEARGVSGDGSVIVGSARPAVGSPQAFIWDAVNGMRTVHDLVTRELGLGSQIKDWTLQRAHAVSPDGLVIVGDGENPQDKLEAWVIVLDKNPSPFLPPVLPVLPGSSHIRENHAGGDFRFEDLRQVNFSRATLANGNLVFADVSGANFSSAVLDGANMTWVSGSAGVFDAASLRAANFGSAHLFAANFENADLRSANLTGANLGSANFYLANLSLANLFGANLVNANLEGADLSQASLFGANLAGADLRGANLTSASSLKEAAFDAATLYDLFTTFPANFDPRAEGLTFLPHLLGDTDGDGAVDLSDLNNVRNSFGAMGSGATGDTNGDHLVDLADLNNVRNNFGARLSAAAPVPEPSALLLGLLAFLPVAGARLLRAA